MFKNNAIGTFIKRNLRPVSFNNDILVSYPLSHYKSIEDINLNMDKYGLLENDSFVVSLMGAYKKTQLYPIFWNITAFHALPNDTLGFIFPGFNLGQAKQINMQYKLSNFYPVEKLESATIELKMSKMNVSLKSGEELATIMDDKLLDVFSSVVKNNLNEFIDNSSNPVSSLFNIKSFFSKIVGNNNSVSLFFIVDSDYLKLIKKNYTKILFRTIELTNLKLYKIDEYKIVEVKGLKAKTNAKIFAVEDKNIWTVFNNIENSGVFIECGFVDNNRICYIK